MLVEGNSQGKVVCNKKAIMALIRGEINLAADLWQEAMAMKDKHFDT